MKLNLSSNEEAVFKLVFKYHDPDIKLLCELLKGKLIDKKGVLVNEEPDMRFVSKLKSTGLKKISDSLMEIANSLRMDINNPPKKYADKIKACLRGLNFMINAEIYIIYLLNDGPIAWYVHESNKCSECVPNGICSMTLGQIINERGLNVPKELLNLSIDNKADWVFKQILK